MTTLLWENGKSGFWEKQNDSWLDMRCPSTVRRSCSHHVLCDLMFTRSAPSSSVYLDFNVRQKYYHPKSKRMPWSNSMTKSGQNYATTNFDQTSIDPNSIDLCTRQDTIYRFNFLICLVWPGQSNTAEWKLTSLSTSLQVSIFNTLPKDFVLVIVYIIWCRQGGEARDEHAQCGRHQQRGQGGSCQDITSYYKMHIKDINNPLYWNNNPVEDGQPETYWWTRRWSCHLLRRQSTQVEFVLLQNDNQVEFGFFQSTKYSGSLLIWRQHS